MAALVEQAQKLTLSSRAFYNSVFGRFAQKITDMFGYDMVLPMNTGAEAVETALKLARKWAYQKKGVKDGRAIILSAEGNFHGRTLGVISMSTDPESRTGFGPYLEKVGPPSRMVSRREQFVTALSTICAGRSSFMAKISRHSWLSLSKARLGQFAILSLNIDLFTLLTALSCLLRAI